jgi:hypothetical protein
MLLAVLRRGNHAAPRAAAQQPIGRTMPPEPLRLAPGTHVGFNLNKLAYLFVAAFKSGDLGRRL